MSLEEFLLLLTEWGKWSRGGIPKYRSFLDRSFKTKPLINDDVALELDAILCDARRKLTAERTYSFELYYKGGWSVSSIAAFRKIDRRTVDAEIRAMENVMFVGYRE